jgi:hypothetical protein
MAGEKPLFGTTNQVNEAFPGVISVDLHVSQDPNGYYRRSAGQNTNYFTLQSLSRHVDCLNPRCNQGGLDLQNIVRFFESGEYDFWCRGHEGTPKGRKVGDSCDNRFSISLKIERSS